MNYLVVGAGNASRPVARLLNHLGHNVTITDLKEITAFKSDVQRILLQMENEGIKLDLGNKNPNLDGIEAVYAPPTLPDSAPIAKLIKESDVDVLTNKKFSKIVNDLIPVDIIGITGTMGKTTTTFITTSLTYPRMPPIWAYCLSTVSTFRLVHSEVRQYFHTF